MPGPDPEALLDGLRCAAPNAALVTFSGHEPSAVAGAAVEEITLHVPKTTDLTAAARAVGALEAAACAREGTRARRQLRR